MQHCLTYRYGQCCNSLNGGCIGLKYNFRAFAFSCETTIAIFTWLTTVVVDYRNTTAVHPLVIHLLLSAPTFGRRYRY